MGDWLILIITILGALFGLYLIVGNIMRLVYPSKKKTRTETQRKN